MQINIIHKPFSVFWLDSKVYAIVTSYQLFLFTTFTKPFITIKRFITSVFISKMVLIQVLTGGAKASPCYAMRGLLYNTERGPTNTATAVRIPHTPHGFSSGKYTVHPN